MGHTGMGPRGSSNDRSYDASFHRIYPLTPWEISEQWYNEDDIIRRVTNSRDSAICDLENIIPQDVHSVEFAKWLTLQYRLAMAKGIEMGRSETYGVG